MKFKSNLKIFMEFPARPLIDSKPIMILIRISFNFLINLRITDNFNMLSFLIHEHVISIYLGVFFTSSIYFYKSSVYVLCIFSKDYSWVLCALDCYYKQDLFSNWICRHIGISTISISSNLVEPLFILIVC